MKFKILTIVGARPNFVKAAPVSKALAAAGCFEEIIVHTGQHYDYQLSEAFFKELEIPTPKYNLEIGSGRQAWQLGEMIAGIDAVIDKENPDAIIVFGDTNSTAAGAVAGTKNNITVAHVEAGLREFNKTIPEEVNKLLITASADLFFCPTPTSVSNLAKTGITENVHLVGDVGIDLIFNNLEKIEATGKLGGNLKLPPNLKAGQYIFVTCHRAANTEDPKTLHEILSALEALPLPYILPLHPRTRRAITTFDMPIPPGATEPLGFFETQALIRNARMVITDSGGVIKEAYFHKTPGIIIDRQTEWIETVEEGWNVVVGPDKTGILDAVVAKSGGNLKSPPDLRHSNCLGDGTASLQIAKILQTFLASKAENPANSHPSPVTHHQSPIPRNRHA
jgi:UDP-N-acetylglucosamine 2-epimerase